MTVLIAAYQDLKFREASLGLTVPHELRWLGGGDQPYAEASCCLFRVAGNKGDGCDVGGREGKEEFSLRPCCAMKPK